MQRRDTRSPRAGENLSIWLRGGASDWLADSSALFLQALALGAQGEARNLRLATLQKPSPGALHENRYARTVRRRARAH
jgi:hypothetical protein